MAFHVHEMNINLIKFDIDINNDELLKTIWKHKGKKKKKKKKVDWHHTGSAQQPGAQIYKRMYKKGQLTIIIIVTHIVSLQHIFQHYIT
jgi:hypothetical protein